MIDEQTPEPVLVNGELVDPTVPGSMADYEPPTMTAEESNDANDGYTLRTWLDVEAMNDHAGS